MKFSTVDYSRARTKPQPGESKRLSKWIFAGYVSVIFGGLAAMFIGSLLLHARKRIHGGRIHYAYNERSRKHGKIILALGTGVLILFIFFFLSWIFLEKILFGTW